MSFLSASRCAWAALAVAFSTWTSSRQRARATCARSRGAHATTRSRSPRATASGGGGLLGSRPGDELLGDGMRKPDVDGGEKVPRAPAFEVGHPEAPKPQPCAVLGSGRNRQLGGRATKRRDAHGPARQGRGQGRRHADAEVVAGTREGRMRSDMDANEEITSLPTSSTRTTLAGGTYPGALVDPRGDLHLDPAWTIG